MDARGVVMWEKVCAISMRLNCEGSGMKDEDPFDIGQSAPGC